MMSLSKQGFRARRSTGALLFVLALLGCGEDAADAPGTARASQVEANAPTQQTTADAEGPKVTPSESSNVATPQKTAEQPKELPPPNLGAMAFQTPVYPEMRFGDERLGYLRQGAKVPADPTPEKKANCKDGWYKLAQGGYVCGKYATLDLEHARVRLGVKQPDLSATVPYQYAYNRYHGTPLYKKLPTKEEMFKIEPHLEEKEKAKKEAKEKKAAEALAASEAGRESGKHKPEKTDPEKPTPDDGNVPSSDTTDASQAIAAVSAVTPTAPAEEGVVDGEVAPETNPKPWWQSDEKNPSVSLADLEKDRGGSLDKRMVRGFFVAIDKTLAWSGRTFYRTTSGLIAPADRMFVNKAPDRKGTAWAEGAKSYFFMLSEKGTKFELKTGDKSDKMETKGKLARFTAVPLTGESKEISGTKYLESTEGYWVKSASGATTSTSKRPEEVGASERWVDVNLTEKTLVLFEGDKPIYAALVSTGKRSRNKKKDHATPAGSFRVREKHVAVTMDGDGAAGDLPYSIEDVPYVAYFKGSYALHAAFWHSNFGREMSHGCVNLAPKDAKVVFDFIDPQVPVGWHGVYASKDQKGSLVVLHE